MGNIVYIVFLAKCITTIGLIWLFRLSGTDLWQSLQFYQIKLNLHGYNYQI